jgi:hypothetical protein
MVASDFDSNHTPLDLDSQLGQRVLASMIDKITERKNILGFSAATASVFCLAFAEGLLKCKKPHYQFALRYAAENGN